MALKILPDLERVPGERSKEALEVLALFKKESGLCEDCVILCRKVQEEKKEYLN